MAWDHEGSRHERGYGYEWTKRRERVLHRDLYLCQPCLTADRTTQATQVDHIIPKAQDGADDYDNLQAICDACHKQKTRDESTATKRTTFGADGWPIESGTIVWGYSIPNDVRPSNVPVVLVCGAPGSGKTTWAQQQAQPGDIIIDLDAYKVRAGGLPWDRDGQVWRKASAMRDADIRSLARRTDGRCYLIVGAPTKDERDKWREALGDVTVHAIETPEAECLRRIKADPARSHAADQLCHAVTAWWSVQ